jgi:hypothetical protein
MATLNNNEKNTNNEEDVILVPNTYEEYKTEINKEMERQRKNGEVDTWRLIAIGMSYYLSMEENMGVIDLSGVNMKI